MFTPFFKDDKILEEKPFLDYEVQFNLFYKIIEGKIAIALKTSDHNAIALQNPGFAMWFWVNENLEQSEINNIIESLCYELKDNRICKISGRPDIAKKFSEKYSKLTGANYKFSLGMEAYECKKVIKPNHVSGKMIQAQLCHKDIVAGYCSGFLRDCFGTSVSKDSQIAGAEWMIKSENLFLWQDKDEIVSMASIAHRSKRYARVDNVYTPFEQRKHGYASALTAELSSMVLKDELLPMLYADINNPDSNKVYKSIGYEERGRIDDYAFKYD